MISKTPARSKCSRCKASSRHNARYDATKTTPHCLRHSDSLPVACFPSLQTGEISAVRKESALVQVHRPDCPARQTFTQWRRATEATSS
jgi:hypothetical protein